MLVSDSSIRCKGTVILIRGRAGRMLDFFGQVE